MSRFVDSFVIENVTIFQFFQYSTVMPWENGSKRLPFLRDVVISAHWLPLNCSVTEPLGASSRVGRMSKFVLGFGFGCVELVAGCCEWGWDVDDSGDSASLDEPPEDGLDSPSEGVFFSFLGEVRVLFMAGCDRESDGNFDSSRISFLLPEILAV